MWSSEIPGTATAEGSHSASCPLSEQQQQQPPELVDDGYRIVDVEEALRTRKDQGVAEAASGTSSTVMAATIATQRRRIVDLVGEQHRLQVAYRELLLLHEALQRDHTALVVRMEQAPAAPQLLQQPEMGSEAKTLTEETLGKGRQAAGALKSVEEEEEGDASMRAAARHDDGARLGRSNTGTSAAAALATEASAFRTAQELRHSLEMERLVSAHREDEWRRKISEETRVERLQRQLEEEVLAHRRTRELARQDRKEREDEAMRRETTEAEHLQRLEGKRRTLQKRLAEKTEEVESREALVALQTHQLTEAFREAQSLQHEKAVRDEDYRRMQLAKERLEEEVTAYQSQVARLLRRTNELEKRLSVSQTSQYQVQCALWQSEHLQEQQRLTGSRSHHGLWKPWEERSASEKVSGLIEEGPSSPVVATPLEGEGADTVVSNEDDDEEEEEEGTQQADSWHEGPSPPPPPPPPLTGAKGLHHFSTATVTAPHHPYHVDTDRVATTASNTHQQTWGSYGHPPSFTPSTVLPPPQGSSSSNNRGANQEHQNATDREQFFDTEQVINLLHTACAQPWRPSQPISSQAPAGDGLMRPLSIDRRSQSTEYGTTTAAATTARAATAGETTEYGHLWGGLSSFTLPLRAASPASPLTAATVGSAAVLTPASGAVPGATTAALPSSAVASPPLPAAAALSSSAEPANATATASSSLTAALTSLAASSPPAAVPSHLTGYGASLPSPYYTYHRTTHEVEQQQQQQQQQQLQYQPPPPPPATLLQQQDRVGTSSLLDEDTLLSPPTPPEVTTEMMTPPVHPAAAEAAAGGGGLALALDASPTGSEVLPPVTLDALIALHHHYVNGHHHSPRREDDNDDAASYRSGTLMVSEISRLAASTTSTTTTSTAAAAVTAATVPPHLPPESRERSPQVSPDAAAAGHHHEWSLPPPPPRLHGSRAGEALQQRFLAPFHYT